MSTRIMPLLRTAVSYVPSPSLIAGRELKDLPDRLRRRPHEADFLALRSWSVRSPRVIDVGANRGQSIRSLRYVLDDPMIHSCEPNPFLVRHLQSAYRSDDRVEVHPVGLGSSPGTVELHLPRYGHTVYDTRASLGAEEADEFLDGEHFFAFRQARAGVERVDIPIATLDSLGLAADLVKVDVEGMDDEVIIGAASLLEVHHPVLLVEFPLQRTVGLLAERGYEPYAFDATELTLRRGRRGALNTYFLQDRHRSSFGLESP